MNDTILIYNGMFTCTTWSINDKNNCSAPVLQGMPPGSVTTCRLLVLGVGVAPVLVGVSGVGHSTRPLGALRSTVVEGMPLPCVIVAGTRRVAVPVPSITVVGVGVTLSISSRAGNTLTTTSTLARHFQFWDSFKKCYQAR